MYYAGIILAPTIRADALNDLADLKTVINTAASRIGAPSNSSGWNPWTPAGEMGTADVVQNITTSVLRANFNLGLNATKWTLVTSPPEPGKKPVNLTEIGVDDSYIDYINSLPNLSTALVTLGRSWHREMNLPVYTAIDSLQQTINTFSASLIAAGLVHTNSTLRTIRASSTLEDAQQAWSRILNLPGPGSFGGLPGTRPSASRRSSSRRPPTLPKPTPKVKPHGLRDLRLDADSEAATLIEITYEGASADISANPKQETQKRTLENEGEKGHGLQRAGPVKASHYTHQDLWGAKRGIPAAAKESFNNDSDEEHPVKALPFTG